MKLETKNQKIKELHAKAIDSLDVLELSNKNFFLVLKSLKELLRAAGFKGFEILTNPAGNRQSTATGWAIDAVSGLWFGNGSYLLWPKDKTLILKAFSELKIEKMAIENFVLTPRENNQYGRASRGAMMIYAELIAKENPDLSRELISWVSKFMEVFNTKN